MAYFQAAATILPVLTLAAIVAWPSGKDIAELVAPDGEGRGTWWIYAAFIIAVFAALGVGEIAALGVLVRGRPTESAEDVTDASLVASATVLLLGYLYPVVDGLTRGDRRTDRLAWLLLCAPILIAVVGMVALTRLDNS